MNLAGVYVVITDSACSSEEYVLADNNIVSLIAAK